MGVCEGHTIGELSSVFYTGIKKAPNRGLLGEWLVVVYLGIRCQLFVAWGVVRVLSSAVAVVLASNSETPVYLTRFSVYLFSHE